MRKFLTYCWRDGIPIGHEEGQEGILFSIVSDPYGHRYGIEKYDGATYLETTYDSQWLDFRKLQPREQKAWRREQVAENMYLIRDMDERALYFEEYTYERHRPRRCRLLSYHRWHLSTHQIYYTDLGDSFNGVILFDKEGVPVLKKAYAVGEDQLFTELLEENWRLDRADRLFCR